MFGNVLKICLLANQLLKKNIKTYDCRNLHYLSFRLVCLLCAKVSRWKRYDKNNKWFKILILKKSFFLNKEYSPQHAKSWKKSNKSSTWSRRAFSTREQFSWTVKQQSCYRGLCHFQLSSKHHTTHMETLVGSKCFWNWSSKGSESNQVEMWKEKGV